MRNKIIPYRPDLKKLARELRKNSTLSEILLWKQVRGRSLGCEFHRQVPIDNYIVDLFCHELMLCIEIDGCSHDLSDVAKNDQVRQHRLETLGVRFMRINDRDIKKDIGNVVTAIAAVVAELKNRT
jgi:very-short-patch-repair endonuclease